MGNVGGENDFTGSLLRIGDSGRRRRYRIYRLRGYGAAAEHLHASEIDGRSA